MPTLDSFIEFLVSEEFIEFLGPFTYGYLAGQAWLFIIGWRAPKN